MVMVLLLWMTPQLWRLMTITASAAIAAVASRADCKAMQCVLIHGIQEREGREGRGENTERREEGITTGAKSQDKDKDEDKDMDKSQDSDKDKTKPYEVHRQWVRVD